jgi:ethanolamine ammonia-lyase large subunit
VIYRHAIAAHSYVFDNLRTCRPRRRRCAPVTGWQVSRRRSEEMVAARMALADVPLQQFLAGTIVPYEDDEVSRLIIDSHHAAAFAAIASVTTGPFRDWLFHRRCRRRFPAGRRRGMPPDFASPANRLRLPQC